MDCTTTAAVIDAQVQGLTALRSSVAGAVTALSDQSGVYGRVADLIAAAAAAGAPQRTGRLAASGRGSAGPDRATVVFAAEYSGVVHWGWPARGIAADEFASDAAMATEGQWMELITTSVQDVLDTVHGI